MKFAIYGGWFRTIFSTVQDSLFEVQDLECAVRKYNKLISEKKYRNLYLIAFTNDSARPVLSNKSMMRQSVVVPYLIIGEYHKGSAESSIRHDHIVIYDNGVTLSFDDNYEAIKMFMTYANRGIRSTDTSNPILSMKYRTKSDTFVKLISNDPDMGYNNLKKTTKVHIFKQRILSYRVGEVATI